MKENQLDDLSIIIPFKNKSNLTISCLESIEKYYPNNLFEIILVSNNSEINELKKIQEYSSKNTSIKILEYNNKYNYQKINNWAVNKSKNTILLFLNNDIEFTEKSLDLLYAMYSLAKIDSTGVVGCVLAYADNATIQHAGVSLEPGGTAKHIYLNENLSSLRNHHRINSKITPNLNSSYQVTAVTAACCMIRRELFDMVGGFDENFVIGGGDVDLCIRVMNRNKKNFVISSEHGWAIHKEKQSRKNVKIEYSDYYYSYLSYIKGFDLNKGDRFNNL